MSLPPGLALNPLTGQISGTPTTPGTYNFTLRVRDAQGLLRDIPQSITVTAYTPPSLSGALPTFATRAQPYSGQLTRANGTAPFVWSISSGTLPTGITINSATGLISGTPTDTNYVDRTVVVRVQDAAGGVAESTQTIRYANTLSLTGSLVPGVQGTAYSDGFDRAGGHSPFVFAITSGALPSGLSFNSSTGVISGTPASTSTTALTIRVTDASGAQQSASGSLQINSAYTPIDVTGSISNGSQNVETLSAFSVTPNYSGVAITGGNGNLTYSWARISGSANVSAAAPSSFQTSFVGSVAPGATESATFRLTVADGVSSDTIDVTISVTNVYQSMGLSVTLPLATRTVAYSAQLVRTGGRSPFTFAVSSGTLPTGISLNASTGAISGTPTDAGFTNRNLTFQVTDSLGATATVSDILGYRNFPSFSYTPPAAMRTRPYSATASVNANGWGFGTMSIVSGTLPAGIALTANNGDLSGTPTDTTYGTRTLTFRFTDLAGNVVEQAGVQIAYADNLAIAGTLPAGAQGVAYSSSALSATGGHGSRTWSIAGGSLPAGLSINASTGVVSGTPSNAGTFPFTVQVVDSQGFIATSSQSIAISAALSASASPASASGFFTNNPASNSPATRVIVANSVTVTPSGGSPPYTYSWTRISGSAAISAGSPTAATSNFSGTVNVNSIISATFRCTVTDSASAQVTVDVPVSLQYESGF